MTLLRKQYSFFNFNQGDSRTDTKKIILCLYFVKNKEKQIILNI